MQYYIGLDVSLKETFICILDKNDKIVHEVNLASDAKMIGEYLKKHNYQQGSLLAIESGQLSIVLCKNLKDFGFNVICVDARHMAAALSARINKNDKNDAYGIARMIRSGLYKEVQIKNDENCQLKVMLGSRRQIVRSRQQVMGTIRGLLKIYGLKFPRATKDFTNLVRIELNKLDKIVAATIDVLLTSLASIEVSLKKLNSMILKHAKNDADCKLLMTIPGVGEITATTYKSNLDDATRFKKSSDVGAYMGLTPKQYSSGEVNRHGSISKMGPKECRTMLYEAAQSLLVINKTHSKLKAWGLRIAKKKGNKKAIVAVARKLAVIMHRMLVNRTEFKFA